MDNVADRNILETKSKTKSIQLRIWDPFVRFIYRAAWTREWFKLRSIMTLLKNTPPFVHVKINISNAFPGSVRHLRWRFLKKFKNQYSLQDPDICFEKINVFVLLLCAPPLNRTILY